MSDHKTIVENLSILNKILRHDLQNALTVQLGSLELFKEEQDEESLEILYNSIVKSLKLIEKVKDLEYTLQKNGETLELYSARELIEESILPYLDSPIKIKVQGDSSIRVDGAFSSVIDNIISNALIHSGTDRLDITIDRMEALHSSEPYCEIKIADCGIGIPNKNKEKIFKEGFRVGKNAGSGLGLYIVKKVVERYGGEIFVKDNSPQGSIFVLRLQSQ
ncbi:MAG: sensor histidine kinase [Candidatus Hodarchaeota archaeon]